MATRPDTGWESGRWHPEVPLDEQIYAAAPGPGTDRPADGARNARHRKLSPAASPSAVAAEPAAAAAPVPAGGDADAVVAVWDVALIEDAPSAAERGGLDRKVPPRPAALLLSEAVDVCGRGGWNVEDGRGRLRRRSQGDTGHGSGVRHIYRRRVRRRACAIARTAKYSS
jgi:hypothetical protein